MNWYYIKIVLAVILGIAGVVLGFYLMALDIAVGMSVTLLSPFAAWCYCRDLEE